MLERARSVTRVIDCNITPSRSLIGLVPRAGNRETGQGSHCDHPIEELWDEIAINFGEWHETFPINIGHVADFSTQQGPHMVGLICFTDTRI